MTIMERITLRPIDVGKGLVARKILDIRSNLGLASSAGC